MGGGKDRETRGWEGLPKYGKSAHGGELLSPGRGTKCPPVMGPE